MLTASDPIVTWHSEKNLGNEPFLSGKPIFFSKAMLGPKGLREGRCWDFSWVSSLSKVYMSQIANLSQIKGKMKNIQTTSSATNLDVILMTMLDGAISVKSWTSLKNPDPKKQVPFSERWNETQSTFRLYFKWVNTTKVAKLTNMSV